MGVCVVCGVSIDEEAPIAFFQTLETKLQIGDRCYVLLLRLRAALSDKTLSPLSNDTQRDGMSRPAHLSIPSQHARPLRRAFSFPEANMADYYEPTVVQQIIPNNMGVPPALPGWQ